MIKSTISHQDYASRDMVGIGDLKEEESLQTECAALEGVVWRKLDRRVLPLCTTLFVLGVLDEVNIANARVAGMQLSLGMTNYQFTVVLTATYVSFLITMFPVALFLKRVGPHILLPGMAMLYSVVSALQGVAVNFSGLLVCRLFLGLAEGGLYSAVVLYLSLFYPRQRLQIRIGTLSAFTTLCGSLSGLLAAGISRIDKVGGRPGWAWIFILEGIFAFFVSLTSFFLTPQSPQKTHILTEKERAYVISVLKHAGSMSEDTNEDGFSWIDIVNSTKSPQVFFLSIVVFFSGTLLFALGFFEPMIVAGLGYVGSQAQIMSVPPFAIAFGLALISGFISDYYHCRGYTLIFSSLLSLVGFSMFYASTSNHVRYASLFFSVVGVNCQVPAIVTWVSNNSAPYTRRAAAIAMTSVLSQLGGIFATWLLGYLSPAPDYRLATITFIAMSVGMVVLSVANLIYLWRQNRMKAEMRLRMQKEDEPKGLGDRSAWFIYSL